MNATIDYARASAEGLWLRHPVLGDPSFDGFERISTAYVSEPPYEWAVNGSLFRDFDGAWYLLAGLYPRGYAHKEEALSRFEILRSRDEGKSWENLGDPFPAGFFFDGYSVAADCHPDAVIAYDQRMGKYLLTYDWGTVNNTWAVAHDPRGAGADSGSAIAWADKPEGPYTRDPKPYLSNAALHGSLGRYDRLYAATVLPRAHDYLSLALCDSGEYFGWGLACMTAENPRGAWSKPRMLLSADRSEYYPAPVEFYPCHVIGDTVYAPATSVARSRDYQALFCAPLERAHLPEAWHLAKDGGLWHSRALPTERYGIWGQTFHGFQDADGSFVAMYPSRDPRGNGTLNVARRREMARDGFSFSGHEGASATRTRNAYRTFRLNAEFTLDGAAEFAFDCAGVVGPDVNASDSVPCAEMLADCAALRVEG